jgi:hypothetical protein
MQRSFNLNGGVFGFPGMTQKSADVMDDFLSRAQPAKRPVFVIVPASANPPHTSHANAVAEAMELCGAGQGIFAPLPQSPAKRNIEQITFDEKIALSNLLFGGNENIIVSRAYENCQPSVLGVAWATCTLIKDIALAHKSPDIYIASGAEEKNRTYGMAALMATLYPLTRALSYDDSNMLRLKAVSVLTNGLPNASWPRVRPLLRERGEDEVSSTKIRKALNRGDASIPGFPLFMRRHYEHHKFEMD